MHDPMTVAHEVKYPWVHSRTRFKDGSEHVYRESFITVWHVDPEKGGSDDSCGWSYPKLTDEQYRRLKSVAWDEGRHPYFLRYPFKEAPASDRAELEALYRGLVLLVADTLRIRCTFDYAARLAARRIHKPDCIDSAGVFCFVHGYHTNFPETERDSEHDRRQREDHFVGVMANIAAGLLRDRRRWYRHPRWHLHHWQIQVHPWQKLRRWLLTRCGYCGKRLGWNESAIGYSWGGGGPIYHERCTHAHEATSAIIRESQTVGR